MEREGQFFVILDHFLPFYPPNNPKNQNFQKMEESPGDIIILHKCTKNQNHMLHCSRDTTRDGCKFYFSFWAIFSLYPSYNPKNQHFKKMKTTPGDIIILHVCTKNYDHMMYSS